MTQLLLAATLLFSGFFSQATEIKDPPHIKVSSDDSLEDFAIYTIPRVLGYLHTSDTGEEVSNNYRSIVTDQIKSGGLQGIKRFTFQHVGRIPKSDYVFAQIETLYWTTSKSMITKIDRYAANPVVVDFYTLELSLIKPTVVSYRVQVESCLAEPDDGCKEIIIYKKMSGSDIALESNKLVALMKLKPTAQMLHDYLSNLKFSEIQITELTDFLKTASDISLIFGPVIDDGNQVYLPFSLGLAEYECNDGCLTP